MKMGVSVVTLPMMIKEFITLHYHQFYVPIQNSYKPKSTALALVEKKECLFKKVKGVYFTCYLILSRMSQCHLMYMYADRFAVKVGEFLLTQSALQYNLHNALIHND